MPFDASPSEHKLTESNPALLSSPSPVAFTNVLSNLFGMLELRPVHIRLIEVLIQLSNGKSVFELSNREIASAACGDAKKASKIRYWIKALETWSKELDVLIVRRTKIGCRVEGKTGAITHEKSRYEWAGIDPVVKAYYAADLDLMVIAADTLIENAPRWKPNDRIQFPSESTRIKRSRRSVETQLKKIVRHDIEQGREPREFLNHLSEVADAESSTIRYSAVEQEFCTIFQSKLNNFQSKLNKSRSGSDASPNAVGYTKGPHWEGGRQKTTPYNQYPGEEEMNGDEAVGGPLIGKVPNRNGTTTENGENERLSIALGYASEGLYVFPCHTVIKKGDRFDCTCRRGPQCPTPGKHPLNQRGLSGASINRQKINRWWNRWPKANIAIATGKKSGIFVLDVDRRHGGFHSLDSLEDDYKALLKNSFVPLSGTAVSRTGGGGLHFYFRCPDNVRVPSSAGKIAQGLDIKCERGYVIAPGSIHKSRQKYEWHGIGVEIGPAPDWLLYEALQSHGQNEQRTKEQGEPSALTTGLIPIGSRNHTLYRWACGLINSHNFRKVRDKVFERNRNGTARPLENSEIESILNSVKRFDRQPNWSKALRVAET